MKTIAVIFLIFCTTLSYAQNQDIHVLAKINSVGNQVKVTQQGEQAPFLIKLKNPELEKKIKELRPDDEALLVGEIIYEKVAKDSSKLEPVFMIKEIKPVSLNRLGLNEYKVDEPNIVFKSINPAYGPKGITVSPEVSSTIILTGSILLLKSMTATAAEPNVSNTIQNNLIFSAGALATGLFIWDQLKLKKK